MQETNDIDIIIIDIVIITISKYRKLKVVGRTSLWVSCTITVIMAYINKHFLSVVIMQELS